MAKINNDDSTDEDDDINSEASDGSQDDEDGIYEYVSDDEMVEGEESSPSHLEEEHQKLIWNTIKFENTTVHAICMHAVM